MAYDSSAGKRLKMLTKDVQECMRRRQLEEEEIIRKVLQETEIFGELEEHERDEVFETILKYFEDKKERIKVRCKMIKKSAKVTKVAQDIQEEIMSYEKNPKDMEWRSFHKMLTLMVVNATVEDLSTLSKKQRNRVFGMIEDYFWREYNYWGI